MIAVGNHNKINQQGKKWNRFNHMPMQSFLGDYHCLLLLHMDKHFIWLEVTKERITEFSIGFIINTTFNIRKSFRQKVIKCMKTTVGAITQPHISKI